MQRIPGRVPTSLWLSLALLALGGGSAGAQVQVVDMVPNSQSNEANQDCEPNLSVNPANPSQIVGTAFTPPPIAGPNAPIYVSTDGGATWTLSSIVPSTMGSVLGTFDITVRFASTSSVLYGGILRDSSANMELLRTNDLTVPMTILVSRASPDQPYTQAATVMGGAGQGKDRVYVGNNDFGASAGKTATVDFSLDGVGAMPPPPSNFTIARIEKRTTPGQDNPPIRPAVHADGTVYAVFYGRRSQSGSLRFADIVVVRDDAWASGATPFGALTDPSDSLAGRIAVPNTTTPWLNSHLSDFGQDRLGSDLAIAVDPRDSGKVYVAYATGTGTSDYTLHVIRSQDRGATWSSDLLPGPVKAKNAGLAVNSQGKIAFLYQQVTGSGSSARWQTHLRRSSDGSTWDDLVLSDTPANTPTANPSIGPYLGDYEGLVAAGKDFYGAFAANNTPDLANFPNGVTFQRNVDTGTKKLRNLANTADVAVSIDPFFFKVTETSAANDFYVRDWTTNASTHDTGLEPSTNPVFYTTSDVWNRVTNTVGTFPSDQPDNELPQEAAAGSNFMFTRVFRNAPAASGTTNVSAHFMYADFGLGTVYGDAAATPAPSLSFAAAATEAHLADGQGYQWQLPATHSTHVCLAVEIDSPGDHFVPPTLSGRAPGWPTTDLSVLNDNNKAQRNIIFGDGTSGSGDMSFFALARNAALERRDMTILMQARPEVWRRLRTARVDICGGQGMPFKPGGVIKLSNMAPGETRLLRVTFAVPAAAPAPLPLTFTEVVDGKAINGLAIAARARPLKRVILSNLRFQRAVFHRLAAIGIEAATAEEVAGKTQQLLASGNLSAKAYVDFMKELSERIQMATEAVARHEGGECGSSPRSYGKALEAALSAGSPPGITTAHSNLLQALDASLTMGQARGAKPIALAAIP